jgi:hypothetical protein
MARRALPAVLVFAGFLADVEGSHGLALACVLLAIPAAFVLVLECYGDLLEARCGAGRPALAALALFLVLLSAALRSPAVVGGVPQFSVSLLAFALCLYASAALAALVARPSAQSARLTPVEVEPAVPPSRRRAA